MLVINLKSKIPDNVNCVTNTVHRVAIVTKVVVMNRKQVIEVQCRAALVAVLNQRHVAAQIGPDHMNRKKTNEPNIDDTAVISVVVVVAVGSIDDITIVLRN